jgi:hypothetical protein
MKTFFLSKSLIALAVAVAAATACKTEASEQPISPPASAGALPDGIIPDSPAAQVLKLVQAGVEPSVIHSYIANCNSAFNLDANQIIALADAGVPVDLVNAMMTHDKTLSSATNTPVAPPAANSETVAAPVTPVTMNYFNDNLSPYGSWVEVEGYGRCWRPTTVIYDSNWRPYCDRGHWVYTDCGWYWDSDYSWGVTFHYGRWFRHDRFGWCWYPDTVWAPSWVTWRSSDAYCGWAPLPPFAEYRPGFGFVYRGANVSVGFGFGLGADYFTFVSTERLCDRHPRNFRENHERVTQIFNQTTVINNYNINRQTVMNNGISIDRVNTASHHPIQPIAVGELPNARRHGWQGSAPENRTMTPLQGQREAGNHSNQHSDSTTTRPAQNQSATPAIRPDHPVQQLVSPNRNRNDNFSAPPATTRSDENRNSQHDRESDSRNLNSSAPNITSPHPANSVGTPFTSIPQRNGSMPNALPEHQTPVFHNDSHETPRTFNAPTVNTPQQHPQTAAEPQQFVMPAVPEHGQSHEPRTDQFTPRQSAPNVAPRNYSAPVVSQPSASAPTQEGKSDSHKNKNGDQ